jgi:hypothetical protein
MSDIRPGLTFSFRDIKGTGIACMLTSPREIHFGDYDSLIKISRDMAIEALTVYGLPGTMVKVSDNDDGTVSYVVLFK